MSDNVETSFKLCPQTLKIKPSCHFSAKVERIKDRLTGYREDIVSTLVTSLQESMSLKQMLNDALLEYDVEVVLVSEDTEDIEEAFDYIRSKNNAGGNVIAYVRLEVETTNRRLTSKNNHLLERHFPCDVKFDIQEAGVFPSDLALTEKLTGFQPLAITKKRSEEINDWLVKYQEALWSIIGVCQNKTKIKEIVNSLFKQFVTTDNVIAYVKNGKTLKSSIEESVRSFSKIVGEKLSQTMNRLICKTLGILLNREQMLFDMEHRYSREFFDSVSKMIQERCVKVINGGRSSEFFRLVLFSILKENVDNITGKPNESLNNLHLYIQYALEKEIEIVQGLFRNVVIPEVHCRKLATICCGSMVDSTQCSIGFRAESFDHIHVTVSRTVDEALDRKTVGIATLETQKVDEYIQDNCLKIEADEKRRLYKLVNDYSEKLMEMYSNLNRIGICPVMSRKCGIEKRACIVIYCSCKGIIPPDEPLFPREIENTPVDVREGYVSLFSSPGPREYNDPIRMGISIGGKDMKDSGSLGPFVVEVGNKSSMGFLTCQHIFPAPKVGCQVVQPSCQHLKAETPVMNTVCGEIKFTCMQDIEYNNKTTTVDVSYVAIDQRIPRELMLPDIPEKFVNDLRGILRMGQPVLQPEDNIKVYKVGMVTGLTMGCFEVMTPFVRFGAVKTEQYRNLYLVSSDTEFATHGDSGSAVFTVEGKTIRVIGLLLGGTDNKKVCYVIPIGAALQAVRPQLEIHQFTSEPGSDAQNPGGGDPPGGSGGSRHSIGAEASGENAPVLSSSVQTFSTSK